MRDGERRGRARRWFQLAASPRPWLHAAAAFAIGLLGAPPLLGGGLVLLLGAAPLQVLVVVLLAAVLFAGAGVLTHRRPAAAWCALTVLVWAPTAIAALVLTGGSSGVDFGSMVPGAIAGAVAAAVALLTWSGPPRAAVLLLVAVGASVAIPAAVVHQQQARITEAQQRLGSTIRPFVTDVAGYRAYGEPNTTGDGDDSFTGDYVRDSFDGSAGEWDFRLHTGRAPRTVCDGPLVDFGEAAASCTRTAGGWTRISAHGVEHVRILQGRAVRAAARRGTPGAGVLDDALAHAERMSDRYYRHLLLGEQGEYIPELDGLR